jgi:dihydroxyacetone kinase
MFDHAVRIGSLIATMSVSLTSCDVPGSGASFELADNEVELGLGIHGEPGVRRTSTLLTSKEAVITMMDAITSSLSIKEGQRIAVLVNNTGGLSNFDLNIVTNDVLEEIEKRKLQLDRLLVGSYCTSFSMTGVSISFIRTDDEIVQLLDRKSNTPLFNPAPVMKINPDPVHEVAVNATSGQGSRSEWIDVPGVTREQFAHMVSAAASSMIEAEQLLNDLDRCGGDADCGLTAKKGATAILFFMETTKRAPSFYELADITSHEMGGTSGAIYSLLFTSVHSSIKSVNYSGARVKSREDVIDFWARALSQSLRTVTTYSLAEPGDRTMLDTIHAVVQCLSKETVSLPEIADAAREGAASTASMRAKAGRSSYATSDTIAHQPDAGAVALATWISAAISSLK